MCRGNRTLPRVARKWPIVTRLCLRVRLLWRAWKSSLETILNDLYFLVLALSAGGRQLVGPPGGGCAGAAVSPSGWGFAVPPRTRVRWLCLGARSCRRLITVGGRPVGWLVGWLVALAGWWPVRSGLGRWSWPHTVRYRLPRRAWRCGAVTPCWLWSSRCRVGAPIAMRRRRAADAVLVCSTGCTMGVGSSPVVYCEWAVRSSSRAAPAFAGVQLPATTVAPDRNRPTVRGPRYRCAHRSPQSPRRWPCAARVT